MNSNGIIIDCSTTVYKERSKEKNTVSLIYKSKIDIKEIIEEKVIEVVIGVILSVIAGVSSICINNGTFDSADGKISTLFMIIILVCGMLGAGLLAIFLFV